MIVYSLKIGSIRKETDDAVTLSFKQPGLKKIKYQAGQYLTLIFRINGRRYIRPYSFSSTFGIDSTLDVTIKRVPGGIVSNHILDVVKEGDSVEVMEPMGDFIVPVADKAADKHLVLWGVGSGITPLYSILKDTLVNHSNKVTLIYGNRSHSTVIFKEALEKLKKDYPDRFTCIEFHTRPEIDSAGTHIIEGRIQPSKAFEYIRSVSSIEHTSHFICGPSGLKDSVKTALAETHVLSDNIYSEDFEIVKNEEDFKFIQTQSIRIRKDNEEFTVEVIKGKSILEAGLDALIELNYSCQTGNCSVCKGRLIQGEIKTIGVKEISKDLIENEYLLCCSYPVTGDVVVEI
ncbi:ferredoxin--NADP reductase [Cytophaga aurantiaca]|uniref:ferredoxin--NADP reductase n=1 Tax=Cytophaga aurantiaca TaxID=29530 RepID=UPI0003785014|nr:ferredoxin--NADP reductase [Cytophaga aurantiaca]